MLIHPATVAVSGIFLLAIDPPLTTALKGAYTLSLGYSLSAFALASVVLYAIFRHQSPFGKFLNLWPLRHFGRISYSLYLWQQLFTGPLTHKFPLNLVWIILCAEASYFLVELPSFWLRDKIVARRRQASQHQLNDAVA